MTTLAEEMRTEAAAVLGEVDSLRVDALWANVRQGVSYTPGSGAPTNLETNYPVRVLFTDMKREREGDGVQPGDRLAIVLGSDAPFEATTSDRIEVDGERWNVVRILADPAGALLRAQVRRMGGAGA